MAGQDILLGIGLGFATGYFVFTSTGRRMVGAGAGLAGAGAERGARYLEERVKLFEK